MIGFVSPLFILSAFDLVGVVQEIPKPTCPFIESCFGRFKPLHTGEMRGTDLRARPKSRFVYRRSDHYSFAKKGIPIAFWFSGFHPDYHKPSDTVNKINFDKLASTARLVYLVAFRAADQKRRLKVDKGPFKTGKDL